MSPLKINKNIFITNRTFGDLTDPREKAVPKKKFHSSIFQYKKHFESNNFSFKQLRKVILKKKLKTYLL